MKRTLIMTWLVACLAAISATETPSAVAAEKTKTQAGFHPIFDGQTLRGWHAIPSTYSRNKSGGRWVVEHGVVVGCPDIPYNWGILRTDEQFGDFEVVLEMNNDFGTESGLYLRCDENGAGYQARISRLL